MQNTAPDINYSYTDNRRNGFTYDASGNLTFDGVQTFTYDATGQQATSDYTNLHNYYDGDGLRVRKTDSSTYGGATYYLRSSVLGGQVVAEITLDGENGTASWSRGYVYAGSSLLAVQQNGVFFVHEDAVTKSKRVTDINGNIVSRVETDPWGADTNRSNNGAFQPKKFTSYERDANGSDEAMFRRYNRWHSRFDQPDPYEGSYNLANPQSFNRYAYTQNDPVNFVDPSGLDLDPITITVTGTIDSAVRGGTGSSLAGLGGGRDGSPLDAVMEDGIGGESTGPQNPAIPQKPNPNCITNAVAGGTLATRPSNNIEGNPRTGGNIHDGAHVVSSLGQITPVTALPAMAGTINHAGRQGGAGSGGYPYSIVYDVLNVRVNGERLVLGLVDMFYDTGIHRQGQPVVP